MTQIIAAIVGAVALVVLCECCYALGKIEGKKKGMDQAFDMVRQCLREANKADDEADI